MSKDRQDELNYLVNKVEELQAENADLQGRIIQIDHAHGCYMELCKRQSDDLDNAGNELFLQEGKIKELEAKNVELEKKLEIAVELIQEMSDYLGSDRDKNAINSSSLFHRSMREALKKINED
jgi:uncharacterized coiled-coil protein SlyX